MADKEKVVEEILPDETFLEEQEIQEHESIQNLFSEYIEKEYPDLGKIRIYHPDLNVDTEVEFYYSQEFNRLLTTTDLPTLRKMEKILEDRGDWTSNDEAEIDSVNLRISNIQEQLAEIRNLLKSKKSKKTKVYRAAVENYTKLISEINKLSIKVIELTLRKSALFRNTIEKKAEEAAILLKLVRCVKTVDDKPLWESVDNLTKERNVQKIKPLVIDALKFWRGLDTPLSEQLQDLISGI